ncbi:hypothetical protein [Halomonas stenophila]|uniref:Lipoprotein n=1 Tax=Halomonas stenophila TaxID=795312 RepID=A0A7W5HMS3_9GAMM|nr:hypothetical protein [Halomonas stenophila]MBB3232964.1 hypothetical protein [Halomonas stenophila]
MRSIFLLLSVALVVGLAGCSYDPARVSTEPLVIFDDDGHGGGGDFCPPGQAKKGNC